jgi:hypothetical protein
MYSSQLMLKLPRDRSRDHALAAAAFCTDFETAVVALSHGAQPDLSDESLARVAEIKARFEQT